MNENSLLFVCFSWLMFWLTGGLWVALVLLGQTQDQGQGQGQTQDQGQGQGQTQGQGQGLVSGSYLSSWVTKHWSENRSVHSCSSAPDVFSCMNSCIMCCSAVMYLCFDHECVWLLDWLNESSALITFLPWPEKPTASICRDKLFNRSTKNKHLKPVPRQQALQKHVSARGNVCSEL